MAWQADGEDAPMIGYVPNTEFAAVAHHALVGNRQAQTDPGSILPRLRPSRRSDLRRQ